MTVHDEHPGSERYVFVMFWVLELCWQATYMWRVFWNGSVIPIYDLFRRRVFWRAVEKVQLLVKR